MVDLVAGFGEEIQQAAHTKVVGGARPERGFAESVPSLLEHLLSPAHRRDGLAAIKVPHLDREPASAQRFRRELEAMKTHRHPALIRLIDFDPTDPPRWLAMEFHPRGVLQVEPNRSRFRGNALETLRLLRPMAEALGLIHQRGDIHRDIKPNNIFVAEDGSLVLGDWGVVLLGPDPTRLTEAAPAHSRDWVPDWVQFGEERTYTPAVDVFAFAKVIYFLVAGENVMASQFERRAEALLKKHPGARGLHATLSLLRRCIVDQQEKITIPDASSLLNEIDSLLANEAAGPGQQVILPFLSSNSVTDLSMVSSNYPSTASDLPALPALSLPVHISGPVSRFEARVRYHGGPGAIQFRIAGAASDRHELPRTPDDHPGIWTDPIHLRRNAPVSPGWHQLSVHGAGSTGLSGFLLYAMR
jgi:serine/threonine protein kinase